MSTNTHVRGRIIRMNYGILLPHYFLTIEEEDGRQVAATAKSEYAKSRVELFRPGDYCCIWGPLVEGPMGDEMTVVTIHMVEANSEQVNVQSEPANPGDRPKKR